MAISATALLALTCATLTALPALAAATPGADAAQVSTATAAAPTEAAHADPNHPHATTGFYPLWENTAYVQPHREIFLGTTGAQFGVKDVAHVGVEPVHFLYRTPNAYAKLRLADRGNWHFAAQGGFFQLMDEASRSFWSPMYASRLDNPDYSITLVPVSAIATVEVSDWLQVHQTATALMIMSSGPIQDEAMPGYSLVAELNGRSRHSVLLHGTEVGFWHHDFSLLGMSYRYHNTWMEFRLGYFYRMRVDGTQAGPLMGFGVYL